MIDYISFEYGMVTVYFATLTYQIKIHCITVSAYIYINATAFTVKLGRNTSVLYPI